MKGHVAKRCTCKAKRSEAGKLLACKKNHGSWHFVADAGRDPITGKRQQIKQGGYRTRDEADEALSTFADQARRGIASGSRQSVETYLKAWLVDKATKGAAPATIRSYRQHIDAYINPTIGNLRLRNVGPADIEAVLTFARTPREGRRAIGGSTTKRIHATMRSAFASAKRKKLVPFNPCLDMDLPQAHRPKVHPWEPEELGQFLDHIGSDPFGTLYEVIAASGMRRGEALGLRWEDCQLDRGRLVIRQQLTRNDSPDLLCEYCGQRHAGAFAKPKTSSGEARIVDLDQRTTGALIGHRLTQDTARAEWDSAYSDHGLVFAREDGTPLVPEKVTLRFAQLVKDAGCRTIRLHDLRHGRASLLLAAGVDIAIVSKLLGHSSIGITADTYSHLLDNVGKAAAEAASALVPRRPIDPILTTSPDSCDQSVTITVS